MYTIPCKTIYPNGKKCRKTPTKELIHNYNNHGYYCTQCYNTKLKQLQETPKQENARKRKKNQENARKTKKNNHEQLKKTTKLLIKTINQAIILTLLTIKQTFGLLK